MKERNVVLTAVERTLHARVVLEPLLEPPDHEEHVQLHASSHKFQ